MKKILVIICLFVSSMAYAEFYKLEVKKVDSNLYRSIDGKILVKTKYCYEGYSSFSSQVILSYEKYSYDNKLIFENGNTCDVDEVYSL